MNEASGQRAGNAGLKPRPQFALNSARAGLLGMLLFLAAHSVLLSPPGVNPLVPLLIQLTPWLLISPGLLRGKVRSHIFGCFLSLVWFPQAVLLVLRPDRTLWGLLELLLCVLLFWATIFYVRWHRSASTGINQ